jgi:predicted membrane-bound spermidine synthase/Na+-translocating ferredoxin:NAD+ oxidoreductase RnfG subunit
MKFARNLLIFSYGFFTIAAQSLLFREFLTTFEGSDISVGIFFASWFVWVGLGAIIVNKIPTLAEKLLKNIEFVFLIYLPAFILELILIIQARELAGIESFTLLPISAILLLSIVVNAPVSIITGLLFPIACRWIETEHKQPISRVYLIEAAGSFSGGLSVTVLLAAGLGLIRIFFIPAFLVSISVFLLQVIKTKQNAKLKTTTGLVFLIPLCILLLFTFGVDKTMMHHLRVVKWTKLLPAESLTGSFRTAQAEYLYGSYQGQWIVSCQGGICQALPDEAAAGRIAAISLCQKPDAKRILVVGSGLGICRQLLLLPQMQTITWTHSDSQYVRKINNFIPSELKITDRRFSPFAGDIRQLLTEKQQLFDIVIINLPDATNSVLNRYYTLEFYQQLKKSLVPDGLVAVRIAGGENIMGTELVNLGASTKLTLEQVFSRLVLTPGEDTFFIASDSESLTDQPGTLQDRFATIENASRIFPLQGLLSVYLPDRATAAMKNYSRADLPDNFLINYDSKPLTHLYSLLLTAKQSGAPAARLIKHLILAGPLAFLTPILVFVFFRVIYLLKSPQQGKPSSFDSSFLVFSAGGVAIGMVITLCYLYQTYFGSLYLHIGIISSLFMLGLTAGAALTRHILKRSSKQPEIFLFAIASIHSLVLCSIAVWPGQLWYHLTFACFFVLCGICAGCYFPIAAKQLAESTLETTTSAGKLETADHLGASVGGLLTSLILVPVLGTKLTSFLFILLIVVNLPPVLLKIYRPERIRYPATALHFRKAGYILLAVGISVILCSNLLFAAGSRFKPSLSEYTARILAGQSQIKQTSATIESNRKINYYSVYDSNEQLVGYIFGSKDLAPQVRGFGGAINLAIYVDATGSLIDFHIVRSNETPAYLEMLIQWRNFLSNRMLFAPEPFADVDVVTGATVSSNAILTALEKSGYKFSTQILGRVPQTGIKKVSTIHSYLPDSTGVYLTAVVILSIVVIYFGGFWARITILCFNLIVGGIILNAQYSIEQIATFLSLHTPAAGLSGAFILVAGIPLLVIIFGNIYCGYICPFGAMQELLGFIVPQKYKPAIPAEKMQKARFVKYIILFVLLMVFFLSRNRTTLTSEPLISIFNLRLSILDFNLIIFLISAAALVGSAFYTRFWCRYLCPVGAFLSLFNNVLLLKKYLPAKKYGKCEFGLTSTDKMDCLYCDKCRYEKIKSRKTQKTAKVFLPYILMIAVFISAVSISRFLQVVPAGFDRVAISAAAGGQPRDVDIQRVRKMIQQKKLSDKEALFYKTVGTEDPI